MDDDARLLEAMQRLLGPRGFHVTCVGDPRAALDLLEQGAHTFDAMLFDVAMPGMSGLELLARCRRAGQGVPIVMLTADDSAQTAMTALEAGAFGYLTKPFSLDKGLLTLTRAAAHGRLKRYAQELETHVDVAQRFGGMVGQSRMMRSVFEMIERVAPLDVGVLVLGESGTGKELVARAIHERSSRAGGKFVALNCGALPEGLVDSELFGHERGAFTGASAAHAGAFERANGGTVFLDEIGDIAPSVQIRLLRVLQEGEVLRLGGSEPRKVDVRVIAATLVDLESAVERGTFRADLYYRLNIMRVWLPPLRDRSEDILPLSVHLLTKHAKRLGRPVPRLSVEALDALTGNRWPGNVRQLENTLLRALAMTEGDVVDVEALGGATPHGGRSPSVAPDDLTWADGMSFVEAKKRVHDGFERAYVARLLQLTAGNISEAARRAKMDRANFRRAMARCGLKADDER